MNELGLGKLITTPQERDAIHVAVIPAKAACLLRPGTHVDANGSPDGEHVGIVDPYLRGDVRKGQTFWLFLYPGTVTGLRHHWKHRAFDGDKVIAELWLREYAKKMRPYDVDAGRSDDQVYSAFMQCVEAGQIYCYGNDLSGPSDLDDTDELFRNLSLVLGHEVNADSFSYHCSC